MFEKLSNTQNELIYLGLKSLIETKSGRGLTNNDGNHIAYLSGTKDTNDHSFGDSPNQNILFKMLHQLSNNLKKEGVESHQYKWWYDFKDWKAFCDFVVQSYRK